MRIFIFVLSFLLFSNNSFSKIIELENCSTKTLSWNKFIENLEIDTQKKTLIVSTKSKKGEPIFVNFGKVP